MSLRPLLLPIAKIPAKLFKRYFFMRSFVLLIAGLILGTRQPLHAVSFNVSFDSSTASAPPEFFTAFNQAINFYQYEFADPITINMQVGWGEVNGQTIGPGTLGQSLTYQRGFFTYAPIRTALIIDSKTTNDSKSLTTLNSTDPTGGKSFVMSNAEAKALGLLSPNAPGIDGSVGFNSNVLYTFDPQNRAIAAKYDFIGIAEHEISEVMGRYGLGQNGYSSGVYSPLDLFRYSSPGILDLVPQSGAYFSIDGGETAINYFNGTFGGDLSDWLSFTPDSYDAFLWTGAKFDVSAGDITTMDVIGYDAVPEPRTLELTGLALAIALLRRRISLSNFIPLKPR